MAKFDPQAGELYWIISSYDNRLSATNHIIHRNDDSYECYVEHDGYVKRMELSVNGWNSSIPVKVPICDYTKIFSLTYLGISDNLLKMEK